MRSPPGGVEVSADNADVKGAALASYLLFEPGYIQELMALSQTDAIRQRAGIAAFFGWTDPDAPAGHTTQAGGKPRVERRRDPLRAR